MRMLACGQTMAHLPQSMQIDWSQTGMVWAMARFSYLVVPDGNVPSAGNALTGSRSPSPAIRTAVTFLTEAGALSGTVNMADWLLRGVPSFTWASRPIDASMAAKLRSTTAWPRLA